MERFGIFLRKGISLSFFGNHMDQYRPFKALGYLKDVDQLSQIVPVEWPIVHKAHIFKQCTFIKEIF